MRFQQDNLIEEEEEGIASLPGTVLEPAPALEVDLDLETMTAVWKDPAAVGLLVTVARLGAFDARLLFDTGAACNIVSSKFVTKNNLHTEPLELNKKGPLLRTAAGTVHRCEKVLKRANLRIGPYRDVLTDAYVIPGECPFDIILGKSWHNVFNPKIDFPTNIIESINQSIITVYPPTYWQQRHESESA